MQKALKYIVIATFILILAVGITASYKAGREAAQGIVCRRIEVVVKDSARNSFIRQEDIKNYISKEYGRYKGLPLDSLDLGRIEKIVDSKSAVLKSEVYVTADSTLHVDITQRRPVVRFQKGGEGFYADKDGFLFPLQKRFSSYVPIVDGAIPLKADSGYRGEGADAKEKKWIADILNLLDYIRSNGTWRDNITQIHIESNGDIVLIPRAGKERFNIGKADNLREKFAKIEKYYTAIAPSKEEGYYSKVNVKYEGQIICKQ